MRKKISFLIALAISVSVSTTSFAAVVNPSNNTASETIQTDNGVLNLVLEDGLKNVEGSNTEVKLMKDKLDVLNKQYDLDHNLAISLKTNISGIDKLQVEMQQLITPLRDEQSVKKQKYDIDVRLNNIKFDLERQYLNILTCNEQIDNINKTIKNIDEQINKIQQKIAVGMDTSDSLNPLNVQKSQLLTQIDSINSEIDNSKLLIKQYLNIDLSKKLTLSPVKKDFIKFDDINIADKINKAVLKDYGISEAQISMGIAEEQKKIYSKYDNDSSGKLSSAESGMLDAQNALVTAGANAQANLWSKYYTLKSYENAVETQILNEKSLKESYDKAKHNYDNGMIDKVTLDSGELAYDKQKNMAQRAINEYMVTQEQFKYMLEGHASAQPSTQSIGISGIDY